ncbi:MAG: phosphoglucosamine mutase, partial [Acholeplasmataceae bacterium]|nr:phosphoglucosamine mutase [Acholeplasmataceae bacterium]
DKNILSNEDVKSKISAIEKRLGHDALLLVRPSGTEPLVRVTMSHRDEKFLDLCLNELVDFIKNKGGN